MGDPGSGVSRFTHYRRGTSLAATVLETRFALNAPIDIQVVPVGLRCRRGRNAETTRLPPKEHAGRDARISFQSTADADRLHRTAPILKVSVKGRFRARLVMKPRLPCPSQTTCQIASHHAVTRHVCKWVPGCWVDAAVPRACPSSVSQRMQYSK